jgi:two-component system, chemotaxis family, response regulator Rcp1
LAALTYLVNRTHNLSFTVAGVFLAVLVAGCTSRESHKRKEEFMAIGHVGYTVDDVTVDGGERKLLVVDDNPGDVRLVVEALKRSRTRYHINVVEDGGAALAFLQRQGMYATAPRPALILLDLNLPQMSGHEVLAALKGDPELHSIPVVMMSTSSDEGNIARAYASGASCYLIKPMGWDGYLRLADTVAAIGELEQRLAARPPGLY